MKTYNRRFMFILNMLTAIILLYHIISLFVFWPEIPSKISIHFKGDTADQWGPKFLLLILPMVGCLYWIMLNYFLRKPERLNYMNLTEDNKEVMYARGRSVACVLQNAGFIMFLFTNEAILREVLGLDSTVQFSFAIGLLIVSGLVPFALMIPPSTNRK